MASATPEVWRQRATIVLLDHAHAGPPVLVELAIGGVGQVLSEDLQSSG